MHDGGLFGNGATIRQNAKGVELKSIVINETKWIEILDERIEFNMFGINAFAGTWVSREDNWEVVLLGNFIQGITNRVEIVFDIEILFTVKAHDKVFTFFDTEAATNIAGVDFGFKFVEDFGHW